MENNCTLYRSRVRSNDGQNELAYYAYVPTDTVPRAVIQICHGMKEYVRRYELFAQEMCARGYAVCGHDHLGHGETAKTEDDLGFVAEKKGADLLVEDLYTVTGKIRADFEGVPVILLGHSMGSFVGRALVAKYPNAVDGFIISGTGGPESPTALGKLVASMVALFRGKRYRSKLLHGMAMGGYTKRMGEDAPRSAWLTRDEEIVRKYDNDPFCKTIFTVRGFYDLFDLLGGVSKKSWAKKLRRDLPVLMISGDADPVGNYGKGVKVVYDRLCAASLTDVTLKLYGDARHELLNETNRDEVIADILEWLSAHNW